MTNGTVAIGQRLVERAGVQDTVELVMDGQEAGAWKPSKDAYKYCCSRMNLDPGQVNPTSARMQWRYLAFADDVMSNTIGYKGLRSNKIYIDMYVSYNEIGLNEM